MGRKRRGRLLDGVLVLDKPNGISSNRALQVARAIYYAAKAGHTGSLDPLATGVLPLCFGEATKFSQFVLDADKAYRSTFALGQVMNTSDADGELVSETDASGITETQVEAALVQFRGPIKQIPSMFSALKKDGQPLYKLARQGIEVERKARSVTIYELTLEAFRPASEGSKVAEADVYVRCSKGTYVRSIAEDVGQTLGVGGHVKHLRRTGAGPFDEADCVTLKQLEELKQADALEEMDALLMPVQSLLGHLPVLTLIEASGYYMRQGQPVMVPNAPLEGLVSLQLEDGRFIGIGEMLEDGRVGPKRLITS